MIPHSKHYPVAPDYPQNAACGEVTERFRQELESFFDIEECLVTPSGTSALLDILHRMNIGKGDEVIVPSYVCKNVAGAVLFTGAKPVFCDLAPCSWNMSAETVRPHIHANTKAIIAVHMFGIPCGIEAICGLGIPVIEDCSHAFGARINGKPVGSFGEYGFFSFQGTKCLSSGEGGAIISAKHHLQMGILNFMSDLQSALGLVQLKNYPSFLQRRRQIADFYLRKLPKIMTERLKKYSEDSIFFRFPITVSKKGFSQISEFFAARGIAVRRGVDSLCHREAGLPDGEFSNTVETFEKTVSLPIYPAMTDEEMKKVTETVLLLDLCLRSEERGNENGE